MLQPDIFWTAAEVRDAFYDGKFVVHNEHPSRHFLVFADPNHFLQYQATKTLPERCFHEVMFEAPRHLYLDLDAADMTPQECRTFITQATRVLKKTVPDYFGRRVDWKELVRISACGRSATKNVYKFSLHMRLPGIVAPPGELREFAKVFAAGLSKPDVVDLGVYTCYKTMRILGSTKLGDNRNSKALDRRNYAESFYSSLIGWYPQTMIVNVNLRVPPPQARPVRDNYAPDAVKNILGRTTEYHAGHEFRNCRGNRLYFDKIDPPECRICRRVHDNDNAMYMEIHDDYVGLRCHRDPDRTEIRILDL